jgi:hypothetical protein
MEPPPSSEHDALLTINDQREFATHFDTDMSPPLRTETDAEEVQELSPKGDLPDDGHAAVEIGDDYYSLWGAGDREEMVTEAEDRSVLALLTRSFWGASKEKDNPDDAKSIAKAKRKKELEQAYWNRRYAVQPESGDIRVADVLQLIFLFLAADRTTLLAAGAVCRAWRVRIGFVPQWFLLSRWMPRAEPGKRIRRALDVHKSVKYPKVQGRESFFLFALRSWEWKKEQERQRNARMRKLKCQVCVKGVMAFFASLLLTAYYVAIAGVIFLTAYATGSATSVFDTDEKVGGASYGFGLLELLFFGLVMAVAYCCCRCARWVWNGRNPISISFYATVAMILGASIFGPICTSLLWSRVAYLDAMLSVPVLNLTACGQNFRQAGYNPLNPPYYIALPTGEANPQRQLWIQSTNASIWNGTGSDAFVYQSLTLNRSYCPQGLGFPVTTIGVLLLSSEENWWATQAAGGEGAGAGSSSSSSSSLSGGPNRNESRSLPYRLYRTTRIGAFSPLPWFLKPQLAWPSPTAVFPFMWLPQNIPVIGGYPESTTELHELPPAKDKAAYTRSALVIIAIFLGFIVLAAWSTFIVSIVSRQAGYRFLQLWIIVAALPNNPLTFLVVSSYCYFVSGPNQSICLMDSTMAQRCFILACSYAVGCIIAYWRRKR